MPRRKPKSLRPAGRPTLLDADVHDLIISATRGGAPMWAAAEYAGIACSTFEVWMRRGYAEQHRLENEDGAEPDPVETPYMDLWRDMQQARGRATVNNALIIQKAAIGGIVTEETVKKYRDPDTGVMVEERTTRKTPPDWKASAWWLERRDAANFGKADQLQVEMSGPGGGPVEIAADATKLTEKVQENIAALIAARPATMEEIEGDDVQDAEVVP